MTMCERLYTIKVCRWDNIVVTKHYWKRENITNLYSGNNEWHDGALGSLSVGVATHSKFKKITD